MDKATYRRAPGVLLREIEGELLLLNTDTDSYFGLNPSGASMFQHLVDGATVDETVTAISDEFAIDGDIARDDLELLIDRLVSKGLLHKAPAPS